eukprot:TRINITY_DN2480_c0_g1_i1.p2 TRINITY_DN2480_c0_g1~~TRINITY_DN2480_c0_g1_i1.p2  ORF type:complete len:298 (+),score=63.70 TRINITY_DN2480_c0_g1_i1:1457-2350(+)
MSRARPRRVQSLGYRVGDPKVVPEYKSKTLETVEYSSERSTVVPSGTMKTSKNSFGSANFVSLKVNASTELNFKSSTPVQSSASSKIISRTSTSVSTTTTSISVKSPTRTTTPSVNQQVTEILQPSAEVDEVPSILQAQQLSRFATQSQVSSTQQQVCVQHDQPDSTGTQLESQPQIQLQLQPLSELKLQPELKCSLESQLQPELPTKSKLLPPSELKLQPEPQPNELQTELQIQLVLEPEPQTKPETQLCHLQTYHPENLLPHLRHHDEGQTDRPESLLPVLQHHEGESNHRGEHH